MVLLDIAFAKDIVDAIGFWGLTFFGLTPFFAFCAHAAGGGKALAAVMVLLSAALLSMAWLADASNFVLFLLSLPAAFGIAAGGFDLKQQQAIDAKAHAKPH
ncbi:MAG: hypothetical protein FJ293_06685 [Planctomycetes bacterium]|nr:hypothetical protein [Planctomycetota bacterium]